MNMKRICAALLGVSIIITGCAKESDNQASKNKEEVSAKNQNIDADTKSVLEIPQGKEIEQSEVKYFIADQYFYDSEETDFADYTATRDIKEDYHIKVLSAKASPVDGLQNLSLYFEQDREEIEEVIVQCMEEGFGYSEQEIALVETEYEITNISETEKLFAFRIPLLIWMRIPDKRGTAYGLPDKRVTFATPYIEFWKVHSQLGSMDTYNVNLLAGQTIRLKCLYLIPKEFMQYELYLSLYHKEDGEYNKELNCQFPTSNELTKFLRIPLKGD